MELKTQLEHITRTVQDINTAAQTLRGNTNRAMKIVGPILEDLPDDLSKRNETYIKDISMNIRGLKTVADILTFLTNILQTFLSEINKVISSPPIESERQHNDLVQKAITMCQKFLGNKKFSCTNMKLVLRRMPQQSKDTIDYLEALEGDYAASTSPIQSIKHLFTDKKLVSSISKLWTELHSSMPLFLEQLAEQPWISNVHSTTLEKLVEMHKGLKAIMFTINKEMERAISEWFSMSMEKLERLASGAEVNESVPVGDLQACMDSEQQQATTKWIEKIDRRITELYPQLLDRTVSELEAETNWEIPKTGEYLHRLHQ